MPAQNGEHYIITKRDLVEMLAPFDDGDRVMMDGRWAIEDVRRGPVYVEVITNADRELDEALKKVEEADENTFKLKDRIDDLETAIHAALGLLDDGDDSGAGKKLEEAVK